MGIEAKRFFPSRWEGVMAWRTATVVLEKASCPAVAALGSGSRLQCARQGAGSPPVGWLEGKAPAGWKTIAQGQGGRLATNPSLACSQCPLAQALPGLVVSDALVRDAGVSVRFLYEDPEALQNALDDFASAGQRPRLQGCTNGDLRGHPASVSQALTVRQEECLRLAQQLGYFDADRRASVRDLADAMGCHAATAHEHLRKAVQKAVAACAPVPTPAVEGAEGFSA